MKLIIKNIDADGEGLCGDERVLIANRPSNMESFFFTVTLEVGPFESEGGDNFHLLVCTRAGLSRLRRLSGKSYETTRKLIVDAYDWVKIKQEINQKIKQCECPTWEDSLECLRQEFNWEFEGMYNTKSHGV